MTSNVEKDRTDIGALREQDEQQRLRAQRGHNRHAAFVLEDCCHERAPGGVSADFIRCAYQRRDVCRDVIEIEPLAGTTIDYEAVAPDDHGGFDAIAPFQGMHEVANSRGLGRGSRHCVAKHNGKPREEGGERQPATEIDGSMSLEVSSYLGYCSTDIFTGNDDLLKAAKRARILGFGLAFMGTATIASCDDPFALQATNAVIFDTLSVYAITGTPVSFPAGWNSVFGRVARIDPSIDFDVAFDIEASGNVRMIPARLVSTTKFTFGVNQATQQVGLQVATGTFESVSKAPARGYTRDSVLIAPVGQTVILEIASDVCSNSFGQGRYAKMVIDSVNATSRLIFFRSARDPNCGFRSFLPGVPKS